VWPQKPETLLVALDLRDGVEIPSTNSVFTTFLARISSIKMSPRDCHNDVQLEMTKLG